MGVRWRTVFLIILIAILTGWFAFHFLLENRIRQADFKTIAENKVGELLNATVKIGNIRVNWLNQIALTDLDLKPRGEGGPSYQIHVRQVAFRYGLGQLVTQNFSIPAEVVLKTPHFLLRPQSFPYSFFQQLKHGKKKNAAIHLQLEKGTVRFPLPGLDSSLILHEIQGIVRPSRQGKLSVRFRAALDGMMNGRVQGEGEIDPFGQTHHFVLDLKSVRLDSESGLALENFEGRIRWEGDRVMIEGFTGNFQGWKIALDGRLEHLNREPVLDVGWIMGDGKVSSEGKLEADFLRQNLKGEVSSLGKTWGSFEGRIRKDQTRLWFQDLRIFQLDYTGHGWIDFKTGNSRLDFKKGKQSFAIESNIKHLNFDLVLNLNHLKWFGLDWVTAARIHFNPVISPWDKRLAKWRASLQTDYFVLEYMPFDDFQGTFDVTSYGVRNLTATWGSVFELGGDIAFRGSEPQAQLDLRINGFDLARIREFASKPLPRKLAGILEGRVKFEGPLSRPTVQGNVKIKDGQLGKLPYDLGLLQFHGIPPYIKLYNSHVLKGRTTLLVTGVLDFTLSNILNGIRIQTSDNLILLKGWDMSASDYKGDLEIDSPFANIPALGVKTGRESPAELAQTASKKEEESYLVAGPRFKF